MLLSPSNLVQQSSRSRSLLARYIRRTTSVMRQQGFWSKAVRQITPAAAMRWTGVNVIAICPRIDRTLTISRHVRQGGRRGIVAGKVSAPRTRGKMLTDNYFAVSTANNLSVPPITSLEVFPFATHTQRSQDSPIPCLRCIHAGHISFGRQGHPAAEAPTAGSEISDIVICAVVACGSTRPVVHC